MAAPSTSPWSRIPTHMLSMPAIGSLGQARAYSSDSKDDVPDIGLGFQSLGSLFPQRPAPGRYSQPKERRANEEASSTVHEERAPSEVSQQETTSSYGSGRYSQPRDKKVEDEAAMSTKDEEKAPRKGLQQETMPPPKAPFFGSVAPGQSDTPEQADTSEQVSEPAVNDFRLQKVNKDYDWPEGKWEDHISGELHAREVARTQKAISRAESQDSAKSPSSLSSRRERRVTQTTKKPKAARADKAAKKNSRYSAPNPVAGKGRKALSPSAAEPQPSKDAWGLSQDDQTTAYSPTSADPLSTSSANNEPSKPTTTSPASRRLTHVRPTGEAHMVDVGVLRNQNQKLSM